MSIKLLHYSLASTYGRALSDEGRLRGELSYKRCFLGTQHVVPQCTRETRYRIVGLAPACARSEIEGIGYRVVDHDIDHAKNIFPLGTRTTV